MARLLERNLQLSLFSHFLFSCIPSQLFSLISIYFLIWSINLVLGLPLVWFPSIFVCSIFLSILSSLILITCPNYLNALFWMLIFILSTPSSNLLNWNLLFFYKILKRREEVGTYLTLVCRPLEQREPSDVYRRESGRCHTLPFFLTFLIISPFQIFPFILIF